MVSTELHSYANSTAIALLETQIVDLFALLGYTWIAGGVVTAVNEVEDLIIGQHIETDGEGS